MATTNDLKNGLVLNLDGELWAVVEFQHVKPGKGGAFVRTTLKNVLSGKVVDKTFNAGTKVETATVDKRTMQYLYADGEDYVFMDLETFDQITVPRLPVDSRTVGRTYEGRDGMVFRPSMFLTLPLGSYGRVHTDGTPVDPDSYDYRRAAWDAVHFASLVDRWWQNLRRVAGWDVQYFATVEPQRRAAPHLHTAIRGSIPHEVIRQVTAATYHQVWWPHHDQLIYSRNHLPVWDANRKTFV